MTSTNASSSLRSPPHAAVASHSVSTSHSGVRRASLSGSQLHKSAHSEDNVVTGQAQSAKKRSSAASTTATTATTTTTTINRNARLDGIGEAQQRGSSGSHSDSTATSSTSSSAQPPVRSAAAIRTSISSSNEQPLPPRRPSSAYPHDTSARSGEDRGRAGERKASTATSAQSAKPASSQAPSEASRRPSQLADSPAHPPGQQQQHSDADIARVRAALADAGYPNPSWVDIERVFEHMARTRAQAHTTTSPRHDGDEGPAATNAHRVARDELGYTYPTSHSPGTADAGLGVDNTQRNPSRGPVQMLSQDEKSLLHYLEPSRRLERYIQLRERELESMCLRPVLPSPAQPPTAPSTVHSGEPEDPYGAAARRSGRAGNALSSQQGKEDAPAAPHVAPTAAQRTHQHAHPSQQRAHHAVPAMAAQHRRAANIVYNITGDQRFRFFPTTRAPHGSGTLVTTSAATAARRPTRRVHHADIDSGVQQRTRSSISSSASANVQHSSPAVARSSHVSPALTPCVNYYNPERGASYRPGGCSSGSLHGSGGGGGGAPVLSSHSVAYLDPQGCTLRRKADPVKRYQQMRMLWDKDTFLSQRRRPQEAWRTRQITMSYDAAKYGE